MRFRDEYFFLSNFCPVDIKYDGMTFKCAEGLYQALKSNNRTIRELSQSLSGPEAKKLGRNILIREDWDQVKIDVMKLVVHLKFAASRELRERLLATGDIPLVEENTWNDTFWGVCRGKGENHLGRILMEERDRIRNAPPKVIVAGTGHRPPKLGGYSDAAHQILIQYAEEALKYIKPDKVISGMALGWDQALAQAAINLDIPFIAAVPFKGQESRWPIESQERFKRLLSKADETVVTSSSGGYAAWKMTVRNKYMVNNASIILAMYDGSDGGTKNCLNYAKIKNKKIINLYPLWKNNDLKKVKDLVGG